MAVAVAASGSVVRVGSLGTGQPRAAVHWAWGFFDQVTPEGLACLLLGVWAIPGAPTKSPAFSQGQDLAQFQSLVSWPLLSLPRGCWQQLHGVGDIIACALQAPQVHGFQAEHT